MPGKVHVTTVMTLNDWRLTRRTPGASASALRRAAILCGINCAIVAAPARAAAQTDFYNTDAGRPIQVEDAYPTERYAFEVQLAPIRLERASGGLYNWSIEPEITYGVLPRTHVEIGLPVAFIDGGPLGKRSGLAGIELSILYNLNVETRTVPAFGVTAEVLVPAGGLAARKTYVSAKGIATRTYSWARVHLNGRYTFGEELMGASDLAAEGGNASSPALELSRWLAGIAVDRTFPLRSLLVTGELFASRPLHDDADVEWSVGAGIRYQWSPRLAFDAGMGKGLTGDSKSWFVTFGLARAFAIAALMPGR